MKRSLFSISAFLTIAFLVSCQKGSSGGADSSNGTPGNPVAPVQVPTTTFQGPGDGGGGNTCNGKLIESYRTDITTLPEFQEYLKPLFEKLKSGEGDKQRSSPLMAIPSGKTWYMLDCRLNDIPKETNGLYLEKTEQVAVHRSREVFIDTAFYETMAAEEKAKLLMHEMVMGFYLMKYQSMSELCETLLKNCTGDFKRMEQWKIFAPQPYQKLNETDHQRIRAITAWLWEHRSTVTLAEFESQLATKDFDKRFNSLKNESAEKDIELDSQVLVNMIKKYNWAHLFPKFCQFDETNLISQSLCTTTASLEPRPYQSTGAVVMPGLTELHLKMKIVRASDQKTLELDLVGGETNSKVILHQGPWGSNLIAAPIAFFSPNRPGFPGVEVKEGMRTQTLLMILNLANPQEPEIYQMQLSTFVWYSFEEVFKDEGALRYKETYGSSTLLKEESEDLFMEKTLPFPLQSKSKRELIQKVLAPK